MQVEIYINDQQLDTDIDTSIAETKQVNDFFEISSRQSSYTNTFKLPKTEKNKMILGGMGIIANTSIAPYRVHKISVFKNGIQTIADGIGYFKPTDDTFNLYVYSENINLFDKIGSKTLADLNLAYLNHDLNISNWIASFGRNDYTYPLADYGKLDSSTIEINYQLPALFVKFLWDKIFNENGFTYSYAGRANKTDYNPFLKDEWKELAISIDEGLPTDLEDVDPVRKLEISKINTSDFTARTVNVFGNSIVVQRLPEEITEYIRFRSDFDVDGMHQFSNSSQYNRSRIRIQENGFYKIDITGIFYNLQTDNASIYVEKDGVNLFTIAEDLPDEQSDFGISEKIYLRAGDELLVKVVTVPIDQGLRSNYSYDFNIAIDLDNSVTAVNFSSYLSKISQKDFIKDTINFLGLMFRRKGNNYEFISYEELLDPLAVYAGTGDLLGGTLASEYIYEDWSDKFDSVVSDDSKIGDYAKINRFLYRYDNSGDTYADGLIKIDDQTLDPETTVLQRIYRAPDRSTVSVNNQQLRLCRFYEKETQDDGSLKSVKATKGDSYFFRIKKIEQSINYKVAAATGVSNFNGSVPVVSFSGLDFNNVVANRYTAFANLLNYSKKYKVLMFINVLDFHTLDFFKLKYVEQLGRLFYLNKVNNFTGEGLTEVELIQIRTIEKLGEFSDDFSDDFNN
tara:strand:- start:204 stop:2246 length:2043 start_codon:yes stop_codon:yes gene_type:complete